MKFSYRYRDASNYKRHNAVIFRNPSGIPAAEIESIVRLALGPNSPFPDVLQFKPELVGLPTVFFDDSHEPDSGDIELHEFVSAEETDQTPDDSFRRTIDRFLRELANAQAS